MGEVIQLFKPKPERSQPDLETILTDDFIAELVEAVYDIETLASCKEEEEFKAQMSAVKARIRGWPDG